MDLNEFKEKYGTSLAVAQHADSIHRFPLWARMFHFIFISWKCPCCKLGKKTYGIRKLYKF